MRYDIIHTGDHRSQNIDKTHHRIAADLIFAVGDISVHDKYDPFDYFGPVRVYEKCGFKNHQQSNVVIMRKEIGGNKGINENKKSTDRRRANT